MGQAQGVQNPRRRGPAQTQEQSGRHGENSLAQRVLRQQKTKGIDICINLPKVVPIRECKLRQLRLDRVKDGLLLEEEFMKRVKTNVTFRQETIDANMVDKIRGTPMIQATLTEVVDDNHVIVSLFGQLDLYVPILSIVDKNALELNGKVLVNMKNFSVVGVISDDNNHILAYMKCERAPTESYSDIGGLDEQITEIKETVELPLTKPELFEEMGVCPPKGVILYGPPGTGKTLLVKAIANATSATFIHLVGADLVQKNLGEGPKLVRELFKYAQQAAPSIIFIDEIDAIGSKRSKKMDESGGEREIQRTMLELLNQLDGFDSRKEVRIILATNHIQHLDPALIRPGRIDRKIEIPMPDETGKIRIFDLQSSKMKLEKDVNKTEILQDQNLTGADIKAICIEAGFRALRERRFRVTHEDFVKAKEKVLLKKTEKDKDIYI